MIGMDPGELRERIEWLRETSSDDGQGGRDVDFASDDVDWAKIVPAKRSNREQGGKTGSPAVYEVTVRYRDDRHKDFRFSWAGKEFVVTSDPEPDKTREFITFRAARHTT